MNYSKGLIHSYYILLSQRQVEIKSLKGALCVQNRAEVNYLICRAMAVQVWSSSYYIFT